jgi:hypothetical protein
MVTNRLSVLLLLLALIVPTTIAQTIIEPTDREVALAGVLEQVHGFGPPGYGEDKKTDRKILYWVLELPVAVNTPCTPEKPEWALIDCASTKRLRLFFPVAPEDVKFELAARRLRGHKVIATGVVHRRENMGEITPIYMNVAEIDPVKP